MMRTGGGISLPAVSFVGNIGSRVRSGWRGVRQVAAVIWAVLCLGVKPRSWPRTIRNVLARQILFAGVEALRFVALIALMVGVSVVVQAQLWLGKLGQTELLGPILVAVIVREAGPLLVNFVVIGRSGTAIATELANMRVSGEVRVLDAQGIEPLAYLVMPRVVGIVVAVLGLTIAFIGVSFVSGYLSGMLIGVSPADPMIFINSIFGAMKRTDFANVLAKTMAPALLTGAICSTEGLGVQGAITEVPQAATRSVVRSVAALFVVSAVVSVLTYS